MDDFKAYLFIYPRSAVKSAIFSATASEFKIMHALAMIPANLDAMNNFSNPGLARLGEFVGHVGHIIKLSMFEDCGWIRILKRSHIRCRKLYYVVEVDRRPPKKTPIKMAGAAAASAVAKKADRAVEVKRPAVATLEGEEREGGSNHSGTSGEGDDVRETSC